MDLAKRVKESILSKDASAVVYLYGSRARGDNRKDSDWDFPDYRHKGDYDDLFSIEKEMVDNLLEPVKQ